MRNFITSLWAVCLKALKAAAFGAEAYHYETIKLSRRVSCPANLWLLKCY